MNLALNRIFLGFDFYGAGNIGDDLMLQGFLDSFGQHCDARLTCSLPDNRIASQQLRFEQVEWLSLDDVKRKELAAEYECWLGVGGTPFQASGGRWLLDRIIRDFDCLPGINKWMVGVGCEAEVLIEKEAAKRIADELEHIWTRDERSRRLLVDSLGLHPDKITSGGDLAHISLRNIFAQHGTQTRPEDTIGIVYYDEKFERENAVALKKLIASLHRKRQRVFCLANDVRKEKSFESAFYRRYLGGLRGLFGATPKVITPDYDTPDISALVSHYSQFGTILASRYHAILTAAWAGCRVVALDRSSKIRSLADELDIPIVCKPFTVEALAEGLNNAKTVSSQLLEEKAVMAQQSIRALCECIC